MTDAVSRLRPPGRVHVYLDGGAPVLFLEGEIDAAAVAAYEQSRHEDEGYTTLMASAQDTCTVDASAVTFLNSAGIALLVRHAHAVRAQGRRPVLRDPSRTARRVLDLTGVSALFESAVE